MSITIVSRNKTTGQKTIFTGQSTTGAGLPLPQPNADDLVQDVLGRFAIHLLTMQQADLAQMIALAAEKTDKEVRADWGGFNTYVAVRRGMPAGMQHAAAIRRDHHLGNNWRAICRKYGVSKSTVYRILGQKEQADE